MLILPLYIRFPDIWRSLLKSYPNTTTRTSKDRGAQWNLTAFFKQIHFSQTPSGLQEPRGDTFTLPQGQGTGVSGTQGMPREWLVEGLARRWRGWGLAWASSSSLWHPEDSSRGKTTRRGPHLVGIQVPWSHPLFSSKWFYSYLLKFYFIVIKYTQHKIYYFNHF